MIPKIVLVLFLIARAHSICLPGCSENQCCIQNECVEKHTNNCSATQRSSSKEKSLNNRRKETRENLLATDVMEISEKVRQRRDISPLGNVKDVKRLKKEGEPCGACMCPPTFTAGECERHLECVGNGGIDDAPGRCMVPVICCKALTASCLACKARQTVEEFCSFPKRHVQGCQGLMLLASFHYIRCESHAPDFEYKECSAGGRVSNMGINSLLMNSKECIRGHTYGFHKDKIWVSFGCSAIFHVLLFDNTYLLSSDGKRCDRDIITVEDCKREAKFIEGATYVEVHGDGNQLPHGCVWDNVTPGRIYVYWNKIGGVKSLDPKLKMVCDP